jgi:predicted nicotinamide N-methyase
MMEFTPAVPTQIHRLTLPTVPQRVIDLVAPVNPDAFLDDPDVRQRYQADNYMPYWPIIWPAGLLLAGKILTDSTTPPRPPAEGGRGLDLGCGLGLAGIAAALAGWHVTFTDYDQQAVQFAAHNARRNGVPAERIRAVYMDWRQPLEEAFSFIIASDVLYERRLHPLLLSALEKLLAPGGTAWIADPQRTSAQDFPLQAVAAGFRVAMENLEGPAATGGKHVAQLYVVRRG